LIVFREHGGIEGCQINTTFLVLVYKGIPNKNM